MSAREGSIRHLEQRIAYAEYGEGRRTLVLVHGLLMNRHMYDRLAPEMAARGFRVITVDLLGHGASDRPTDVRYYTMTSLADQLATLIEQLELDRPVVGGTSLGANVGLEMAVRHPGRAGALFIEMPVLDNALLGAALIFTPILVTLRFGRPVLGALAMAANRIPRSHYLVDILLDWTRRDPQSSRAVLEGILFGRTAPPREERERITVPALIIGHPADPLHPFSDSDMLAEEMPNARIVNAESIFEWRISPKRLDEELAAFIEEVNSDESASSAASEQARSASA